MISALSVVLLIACAAEADNVPFDTGVQRPPSAAARVAPGPHSNVLAGVAADRHPFEATSPGVFTARLGGVLVAELSASGLGATSNGDRVALTTVGYGEEPIGSSEPVFGICAPNAGAVGSACVRPVALAHGALTEWWVPLAGGLEHGWTLHEAPVGDRVEIRVAFTEGELVSVDTDGQGAWLAGTTGARWRYDGLVAWDADGTIVPSWLEARGEDLVVAVDVVGARWPVTVDPLLAQVEKLMASDGGWRDGFGNSVSGAGDIDGDGYPDLIIGADDYGRGSAYVYYGSVAGIDSSSEDKLIASDGTAGDRFGHSVSGAGDVDGDGYDDVVVGATYDDDHGPSSGSAYIYYGSSTGIEDSSEHKLTAGSAEDYFGLPVAGVGDLDADGYDDMVIGAFGDDDNGSRTGAAHVYYGSSTGIPSSIGVTLTPSDVPATNYFGWSIAGAGDVNGDGYDDLAIGVGYSAREANSGEAFVHYGSAAGVDSSRYKLTASDGGDHAFGNSISGAGDIDGDGYDDVVIGAVGDDELGAVSGSAYVYYGSAAGIDESSETKLMASDGAAYGAFGRSVSGAGDVDGDGYDDLLIGAAFGWKDTDSAYVYFGSSGGIDSSSESKLIASDGGSMTYGWSVSGAGDLDADGYDDMVIGAPRDSENGIYSGAAYVRSGGCRDVDGDGFCTSDADCDDTDATIHPGAPEIKDDGVDQDCDGDDGGCGGCASGTNTVPNGLILLVGLSLAACRREWWCTASVDTVARHSLGQPGGPSGCSKYRHDETFAHSGAGV